MPETIPFSPVQRKDLNGKWKSGRNQSYRQLCQGDCLCHCHLFSLYIVSSPNRILPAVPQTICSARAASVLLFFVLLPPSFFLLPLPQVPALPVSIFRAHLFAAHPSAALSHPVFLFVVPVSFLPFAAVCKKPACLECSRGHLTNGLHRPSSIIFFHYNIFTNASSSLRRSVHERPGSQTEKYFPEAAFSL